MGRSRLVHFVTNLLRPIWFREHTRKPLPYADLHLIFTDDEPDKSVIGGAIYAHQPPRDRV